MYLIAPPGARRATETVRKLLLLLMGGLFSGQKGFLLRAMVLGLEIATLTSTLAYSQQTPIFCRKETSGLGPRAMGMGGAFTAVADHASAAYLKVADSAQHADFCIILFEPAQYVRAKVNRV